MCNVFVEHFDQLTLDYSTPHWFVYVYLQSNEVFHTKKGGGKEGGRKGGKEGREEGKRGEKEGEREGRRQRREGKWKEEKQTTSS